MRFFEWKHLSKKIFVSNFVKSEKHLQYDEKN